MNRLERHLEHILTEVVPQRGAAQQGMDADYIAEIEGRLQPPHLVRGLEQWNEGRFYEQHETLEWLWRATAEPVRDALKGIIQSGVGAYHVQKRNRRGALGKWTGAIGYLAPFAQQELFPYGIDIGHLRRQVVEARQALLVDESEKKWEEHQARTRLMQIRWDPRLAAPRVTALLRGLDEVWEGGANSVEGAIHELTEQEADWLPMAGAPSIRAWLIELAKNRTDIMNAYFGEAAAEENTLLKEPPHRWGKWLRLFREAHEDLRKPLGFLDDEQLTRIAAKAHQTVSIEQLIEKMLEADQEIVREIRELRAVYRARL